MKVYFFNDYDNFDPYLYLDRLPEARRDKALAFRNLRDRQNCVVAFLLLEIALFRDFSITPLPEIVMSEKGKPYFRGENAPFFNISHSKEGVVCLLSETETGIDIQDIRQAEERVILRTMTPNEQEYIKASNNKNRAFSHLWSRKESYLKMLGTGLREGLNTIDTLKNENIKTVETDTFFLSVSYAREITIVNYGMDDINAFFAGFGN